MLQLPCVILSGGKSRRMGEDKSLLPFKEFNTLIQYQHNKLSKLFKTIYISSKTNKFDFDAQLLLDDSDIYSPMVALKSIFEQLEDEKIFIITVDTPFVKEETIKTLIENSKDYEIVIAKDKDKTHNLCGVFSKSALLKVQEYLQKDIHKIKCLLNDSNSKELLFEDEKQFLNLNTPEDYKSAIS